MALIKGSAHDDNDLGYPSDNRMLLGTPKEDDIYGLGGDDIINGLGGSDLVKGGRGNDQIFDTTGNDKLLGGQGNDFLHAGEGDDILRGGDGNDVIIGGHGKDTLIGGAGADTFGITSRKEGIDRFTKRKLVDTFKDFSVLEDNIVISREGFGEELTGSVLKQSQFVIGSAAADKNDRFIYNPLTGSLFFDSDGSGKRRKVEIAKLPGGLSMTHSDILITDSL